MHVERPRVNVNAVELERCNAYDSVGGGSRIFCLGLRGGFFVWGANGDFRVLNGIFVWGTTSQTRGMKARLMQRITCCRFLHEYYPQMSL